jgi:hypothetical protein
MSAINLIDQKMTEFPHTFSCTLSFHYTAYLIIVPPLLPYQMMDDGSVHFS